MHRILQLSNNWRKNDQLPDALFKRTSTMLAPSNPESIKNCFQMTELAGNLVIALAVTHAASNMYRAVDWFKIMIWCNFLSRATSYELALYWYIGLFWTFPVKCLERTWGLVVNWCDINAVEMTEYVLIRSSFLETCAAAVVLLADSLIS